LNFYQLWGNGEQAGSPFFFGGVTESNRPVDDIGHAEYQFAAEVDRAGTLSCRRSFGRSDGATRGRWQMPRANRRTQ
jgi:hypothetical protein